MLSSGKSPADSSRKEENVDSLGRYAGTGITQKQWLLVSTRRK